METNQVSGNKTVLLADDEPAIIDALTELLEEVGYVVQVTSNGKSLTDFPEGYPDLILLDIRMSGVDGGEVCKRLKSSDQTRSIPIIMFSASKDTARIAAESGADDFITKPFDIEDLLTKIERHIARA